MKMMRNCNREHFGFGRLTYAALYLVGAVTALTEGTKAKYRILQLALWLASRIGGSSKLALHHGAVDLDLVRRHRAHKARLAAKAN